MGECMKPLLIVGCVTILLSQPCHTFGDVQPELNVAIQWDSAALQGIRDAKLGAPMVARALAIVHTCMYDSWAGLR